MFSRIRDRIEQLEAQLTPQGRIFIFYPDDDLPHAEQLAAFKTTNGVGLRDTLVTVVFQ
jgi:hypothetical protein